MSIIDSAQRNMLEQIITDKWYILAGIGCAIVLMVFYLILVRFLVKPLVWLSILALIALFGCGTAFFFY